MKPSERIAEIGMELRKDFERRWPNVAVPDFKSRAIQEYLDEQHERAERQAKRELVQTALLALLTNSGSTETINRVLESAGLTVRVFAGDSLKEKDRAIRAEATEKGLL